MSGISVFCDTNIIVYLLDGDKQIAELLHERATVIDPNLPLVSADQRLEKIPELDSFKILK